MTSSTHEHFCLGGFTTWATWGAQTAGLVSATRQVQCCPAPSGVTFWQVWELEVQSPLCDSITIPREETGKAFFKSLAPVQPHCNRTWTMGTARPSPFFMPQLKQWQREVWSSSSPPQLGQSGLTWWVTLITPTQRCSAPYHCAANCIAINLYPITAPPTLSAGFQGTSRAVSTQRQPLAGCHLPNKLQASPVTCQRSSTFTFTGAIT